ncbi:MAG: helix-turn-helix domain-containing protein [Candidatus Bathyarchaeia archaeon]
MDIILMSIYTVLFSITSIFLLVYFKRLRSVNIEYMRIKRTFEDVIFSFNKDLQKIREQIQEISRKMDTGKGEDEMSALLSDLKSRLEDLISFKEGVSPEVEKLKSEVEKLSIRCNEIEAKMGSLKAVEGERGSGFYEGKSIESLLPKFEKSKAFSSLTATELRVLEILAKEGEKTVPEIRERISLTREHTARLMKSLYERGYVERRDDRIPFVYRLAKEMEEIIKKKE